MNCPSCNSLKTEVLETRRVDGGMAIRRSRLCPCGHRFATYEIDGAVWPTVQKWALHSHSAALLKAQALRIRNEKIIKKVMAGQKRYLIAERYGVAESTISAITRKAGIKSRQRFPVQK